MLMDHWVNGIRVKDLIESSSKNLPQIYQRFTNHLPMIYQRFTKNKKIFGILLSKYLPRIYQRFTNDLPKIYQVYQTLTNSLPKYFFNLPRIYHRFTNTFLGLNIFLYLESKMLNIFLFLVNLW